MSATSTAALALPARTSAPSTLTIVLNEIRFEVLRALRTRAFSLSVIGFPIMFYILFGLLMNRNADIAAGISVAKYMLGGYAIFGALGAAIFGIGVGVSLDRSAGWLELKQASPMPPIAYVLAKCAMASFFSILIVAALTLLGITAGHVHITLLEFARIVAIAAVAAIPFSCLGLAMAFLAPPNAAGGIANLIYLPMSFLSGLWLPIQFLPHALRVIAPIFPTYHLAQLMCGALGAPTIGTPLSHWLGVLGFTLIILGVAAIAFRRSEQNS